MTNPIDLDHLERSVFGDVSLRAEVLGLFLVQLEEVMAALHPAAKTEAWRAAAHLLKGASRGVGAFRLGDLCAQAEALGEAEPDGADERIALVEALRDEAARAAEVARRLAA